MQGGFTWSICGMTFCSGYTVVGVSGLEYENKIVLYSDECGVVLVGEG